MASLLSRFPGRSPNHHPFLAVGSALAAGLFRPETASRYLTEFHEMDFEVRRYMEHAVAEITVSGEHGKAVAKATAVLKAFILGKNSEHLKLTKTGPIGQTKVRGGWQVSFTLPSHFDLADLPKALDPRIRVFAVPPRRAAVVSFKGKVHEKDFMRESARLQNWTRAHALVKKSEPVLVLYDPPYLPPFLRKNEVLIEIAM